MRSGPGPLSVTHGTFLLRRVGDVLDAVVAARAVQHAQTAEARADGHRDSKVHQISCQHQWRPCGLRNVMRWIQNLDAGGVATLVCFMHGQLRWLIAGYPVASVVPRRLNDLRRAAVSEATRNRFLYRD